MSFIFPYIGIFIIPTDFHIFQRGWNHQPAFRGFTAFRPCTHSAAVAQAGTYPPKWTKTLGGGASSTLDSHWHVCKWCIDLIIINCCLKSNSKLPTNLPLIGDNKPWNHQNIAGLLLFYWHCCHFNRNWLTSGWNGVAYFQAHIRHWQIQDDPTNDRMVCGFKAPDKSMRWLPCSRFKHQATLQGKMFEPANTWKWRK